MRPTLIRLPLVSLLAALAVLAAAQTSLAQWNGGWGGQQSFGNSGWASSDIRKSEFRGGQSSNRFNWQGLSAGSSITRQVSSPVEPESWQGNRQGSGWNSNSNFGWNSGSNPGWNQVSAGPARLVPQIRIVPNVKPATGRLGPIQAESALHNSVPPQEAPGTLSASC